MHAALPGRFWWLKRLTLLVIGTLALWVAAHAALWRWADRRLEAHVERWRADGGPLPEQVVLRPPTPAQPDNAATYIVQAEQQIKPPNQFQRDHWNNVIVTFPLAGKQLEAMRSVERQHRPVVETLRKAYDQPYRDWAAPAIRIETILPRLNEHRWFAECLRCGGQVQHHEGNLVEALQYAQDILYLGEAVGDDGPALVTTLVATGISAAGTSLILQDIIGRPVPGLSPEQEHAAWRDAAPAARDLIARLLDERGHDHAVRSGILGERTAIHAVRDLPLEWSLAGANPVTMPFLLHQIEQMLAAHERTATRILEARSWSEAQLPPAPAPATPRSGAEMIASGMSPVFDFGWHRGVQAFWRIRAERRAAAVMLAIRLYETDHDGRLPPTLEALVPEYLPSLPADPFVSDGSSFRYLPDARIPLFYSVGPDGTDDGGDWSTSPAATWRQPPWLSKDAPFVLRQPPAGAPSFYQWLSPELYPQDPATAPASE